MTEFWVGLLAIVWMAFVAIRRVLYNRRHFEPRGFAQIVLPACPICGEDVTDPRGCEPCLAVLADIIRERRGIPVRSESRETDPEAAALHPG